MNGSESEMEWHPGCPLQWHGHLLQLLPQGALYWEDQQALLLSDCHLGREYSLQRSGLALPGGPSFSCLNRIEQLLSRFKPQQLIVLGDLVHARCSLAPELVTALSDCRRRWRNIDWWLVAGNHDRGSTETLAALGWQVQQQRRLENVLLCHEPPDGEANVDLPTFCGHIHPGVRLPRERVRLPCFAVSKHRLLFPAFGDLTGTFPLVPEAGERIFVVTDRQVREIPTSLLSPRHGRTFYR